MKRDNNKNYFNPYIILENGNCEFYIQNKKGEVFTVTVQKNDLERLIKYNRSWHAKWAGWAYYVCCCEYIGMVNRKPKYKINYLHRWILDSEKGTFVDHKDNNTFNNLRENLRTVTKSKNASNRKGANTNNKTGIRNISYIEKTNEYWVQFMKRGKRYCWKFPESQFEEACKFKDEKRKELFGKFSGKG